MQTRAQRLWLEGIRKLVDAATVRNQELEGTRQVELIGGLEFFRERLSIDIRAPRGIGSTNAIINLAGRYDVVVVKSWSTRPHFLRELLDRTNGVHGSSITLGPDNVISEEQLRKSSWWAGRQINNIWVDNATLSGEDIAKIVELHRFKKFTGVVLSIR